MKFINPEAKVLPELYNREGIIKSIERAARVSYQSSDLIKEGSADKLVDMLIEKDHHEPLELGTVYLYIVLGSPLYDYHYIKKTELIKFYKDNPYSRVVTKDNPSINAKEYYITSNYRVLIEHNRLKDLEYYSLPTEHIRRVTIDFITNIAITRDLLRHRVGSFVNESTRYCNYTKEQRFGGEITYIIPMDSDLLDGNYAVDGDKIIYEDDPDLNINEEEYIFLRNCSRCENDYIEAIGKGVKPQVARYLLNLATKSEIIMCMYTDDLKHFLELRSPKYGATGTHPDYAFLADKVYDQLIDLELINERNVTKTTE